MDQILIIENLLLLFFERDREIIKTKASLELELEKASVDEFLSFLQSYLDKKVAKTKRNFELLRVVNEISIDDLTSSTRIEHLHSKQDDFLAQLVDIGLIITRLSTENGQVLV